eukprot:TRINITY_DN75477_c0_g1_i1.p1 TRINITY_DN75477_c0_g1~~TRINITY_DN75477_c0_g1_i1.p1  ORF type:complete len:340 (-),score=35.99 TRINITY_DN75477_c0_g1_i1:184-1203(-)
MHETHQDLCNALKDAGCLKTPEVAKAFEAVDRKHFLYEGASQEAYVNIPLRRGKFHQSAPSVYASALEALELTRPDLSFLNVGSGTGYFSALVAQLIGQTSLHIGLERCQELVDHARKKCNDVGLGNIHFMCGNCYLLDIAESVRFDRIYVGAGAYRDARCLFKLLKSGGVIVGPFEDEDSDGQTLIKARRVSAAQFAVSDQTSVSFAWLLKPTPEEEAKGKIRLLGPEWGAETPSMFPMRFKQTVLLLYWMVNHVEGSLPNELPWEFWLKQIIPWLSFDSFDTEARGVSQFECKCNACGSPGASKMCARCKVVRYCDQKCQQQDWPSHKKECSRSRSD